jgi:aspartyl-tRNA(Asn)/glutamyl-tRNA(Gln) amidotransferase subunit C
MPLLMVGDTGSYRTWRVMMSVSNAEILRLAEMTRIGLDRAEAERLTSEMDVILDAVNKLRTVDTSSVKAVFSGRASNVVRPDIVTASLSRSQALANAPEEHEGFFVVPAILGQ